jgi:YbbR domain-containing protein
MGWIVRNWQLKIGAVSLALVLYTGLVYSGSFTDSSMPSVPIQQINQPNGAYVITQQLGTVDVQYRESRSSGARVTPDTFSATVDLKGYDMDHPGQAQALPVSVKSLDSGVTVLSFSPGTVRVVLDVLDTKSVPVIVDRGTVPPGLEASSPVVSPSTVQARGPASRLSQVVRAVARVQIDASGIDITNQPFDLVPVDADGVRVDSIELTPSAVVVSIAVKTVETSKTVPVTPSLTGTPAAGYEISAFASSPLVVALQGAPATLSAISEVATEPFSVNGLNASKTFTVNLVLPPGTTLPGGGQTTVTIAVTVTAQVGSRTFLVGVLCTGAAANTTCQPQISQLSVTVSGPIARLSALTAAQITPLVDASGLGVGQHEITPTLSLPNGLTVLGFSPGQVPVVIAPVATPSP